MMLQWIAYKTIVRREVLRIFRIWTQTLLPSVMTISLYFIIFGNLIGSRIQDLNGLPYIEYITPGLIMLAVITNAYSNVAGSFYSLRFQKCIEELLIAPVSNPIILLGFVTGGVLRGLIVGLLVTLVASLYIHIPIHSYGLFFSVLLLTATTFSLAGFLNALLAKRFDDVAFIPTFVLTPLIYLGGVFYSLNVLTPFWRAISRANPILYLVNAFRFSMLYTTDVPIYWGLILIMLGSIILAGVNLYLLRYSHRIRS
jgi:ABC-2 type transport system permease protein